MNGNLISLRISVCIVLSVCGEVFEGILEAIRGCISETSCASGSHDVRRLYPLVPFAHETEPEHCTPTSDPH